MPAAFRTTFARFVAAIREFTVAQRTLALIGVAVLVVGGVALGAWITRPNYAPLFSGIASSDASAIVDQLTTDGVDYQLADGGSTILVPVDQVDAQRLKAAAAGLPGEESGGYSLLDGMGVTASEFQQSVTYKRALEGELAKTISSLDGVRTASVQLAIPEKTVFVEDTADPTASVFIETRAGTSLSNEQVLAITNLTSAAVDGLSAENVAVVDSDGTVLSAVGVGATGSAAQQGSDYEQRVRSSVQDMLDRVVGPGNATVVVAADTSLETAQRVEESFSQPDGDLVLSESTNTENYTGAGGAGAGVLGPDNIAVPDGAEGDGTYQSDEAVRNNAVNKVTETRNIPAGTLTRQSVSVAVNSDAVTGITAAELGDLVEAAAGIDTRRGDEVAVEMVSFSSQAGQTAGEALQGQRDIEAQRGLLDLITTGVVTLGLLIAAIVITVLVLRHRRRNRSMTLDAGELGVLPAAGATIPLLPAEATDALTSVADPAPLEPLPVPPQAELDRLRAEVDSLAGSDPDRIAETLRSLIDESPRA